MYYAVIGHHRSIDETMNLFLIIMYQLLDQVGIRVIICLLKMSVESYGEIKFGRSKCVWFSKDQ